MFQHLAFENQQLKPGFIRTECIIAGEPKVRSAIISTTKDGEGFIVAWECTAGKFRWEYDLDETLHIIEGSVTLEDNSGSSRTVGAGDMVYFPKGASVVWNVHSQVRKLAICRRVLPAPLPALVRSLRFIKGVMRGGSKGEATLAATASFSQFAGACFVIDSNALQRLF
jgi:uncharacterized protein